MSTLLVKDLAFIATVDDSSTVLRGGGIYVEDNRITAVGPRVPTSADTVIDGRGKIAFPGMVNTHHHLYQTLTRNVPIVQDAGLFDWLVNLYEIWREITPRALYVGTQVGLAELLLTGCTTSTDMFYVFPHGTPPDLFDEQVRAGRDVGARFMPCRGSMSRGRSQGGLPPDEAVQDEQTIMQDSKRVIDAYHDDDPLAMTKIALAPCSPFSVTPELLRETARYAAERGVRCHTHLAETHDEDAYCEKIYHARPYDFMESVGWNREGSWYAHCVHFNGDDIRRAAQQKVGIAHCPTSNFRLGSGLAPVAEMIEAGCRVGLAVDGSASNDSSDMLGEARAALWAQRARRGPAGLTARQAWRLATRGGAEVLGYDKLGSLQVGWGADFFLVDLGGLGFAGAQHDPMAAPLFSGYNHGVDTTVVNGRVVVRDGQLLTVDTCALAVEANQIAAAMVERAQKRSGIDFLAYPDQTRSLHANAVLES